LNKISVAWHDLSEKIGTAMLPVLQSAASWITDKLIPDFLVFYNWSRTEWPKLAAIMAGPFDSLKTSLDNLAKSIGYLVGSGPNDSHGAAWLLALAAQAVAGQFQWMAFWIGGVAQIIADTKTAFKVFAEFLTGPVVSAVGTLTGAFAGMGQDVANIATGIWHAFRDAFNFIIRAWNDTLGKISIHIPGTGIGFSVPQIPSINAATMSAPVPAASGSVINVNLPSGTDGHSIVAALRTYNVRVGGLDLALNATR
jgi:hypothetical protein